MTKIVAAILTTVPLLRNTVVVLDGGLNVVVALQPLAITARPNLRELYQTITFPGTQTGLKLLPEQPTSWNLCNEEADCIFGIVSL